MAKAVLPPGIRPHEWSVYLQALEAAHMVEGGRFLVAMGRRKSALRLIDRKLLADRRTDTAIFPPGPEWVFVSISSFGWAYYYGLRTAWTCPERPMADGEQKGDA